MMKFQLAPDGGGAALRLEGNMDAGAEGVFADILKRLPKGPVAIDLERLGYVNSLGAGHWSRFYAELCARGPVRIVSCPATFLNYANFIPGFVRAADIDTVILPFACGPCRRHEPVRMRLAEARRGPHERRCWQCTGPLSPEVDLGDLLAFTGG